MVKGFITAKPELANCDISLIYAIWHYQLKNNKPSVNLDKITAKELFKHWINGNISSVFNISRSRGDDYVKRQEHQSAIRADVERETNRAIGKSTT